MNEIVAEPHGLPSMEGVMPMDLVQRAVLGGADIAVVERLVALVERGEANRARKAFNDELASAKAEMKPIKKSQTVDYMNSRGQRVFYQYENLNDVTEAVNEALSKYGFTFRWRTTTLAPDQFSVTCILSHRDGHSEENSLPGAADTSGNKNPNQSIGSTATYLQRYTLKAALGLSAAVDDDAQSGPTSGDMYFASWQTMLENAKSHDELGNKWNAELPLRKTLEWSDDEQLGRLKDQVTARIKELTPFKPQVEQDAKP